MSRLVIAALLIAACVPLDEIGFGRCDDAECSPMDIPVCVESALDVDQALESWNSWIGADALWRDDACPVVVAETDLEPDIVGQTTIRFDETGQIFGCDIELQRGEWQLWHLEHELGHCPFGLAHDIDSLDMNSLMQPTVYRGVEPTAEDIGRLRSAYGL